jgi:hypothetical protein
MRAGCQDPFDPTYSLSNLRELILEKAYTALTADDIVAVRAERTRCDMRPEFTCGVVLLYSFSRALVHGGVESKQVRQVEVEGIAESNCWSS